MNLYDIPAELPFLDCLAAGVLAQFRDRPPEALSRATILLPTRRSARGLRDAFLAASGDAALLLPRMRALAGLSTEDADELALPSLLDLPPAVPALTRQAVLTSLVIRLPPRHGGPSTPEQAWALAAELARIFDEIALEEKDTALLAKASPAEFGEAWLGRLEALVPDSQATHWQITTTFLRGVATAWAGWLEGEGLLDIGLRRVLALREQTRAWQEAPPRDPVIAAGIGVGGTIPAAVELLRVLAGAPQGAVLLHGIDRETAGPLWEAIAASAPHPFSSQARLLAALGATPRQVRRWPGCSGAAGPVPEARPALLEMALRPPEGMQPWTVPAAARWAPGLAGLQALVAPDAQAEAAAIAMLLREALERPGARAALITPDRDLARRVSADLLRHGIRADDSAGQPLAQTPTGVFLRLLARTVAEDFAPVPLLALAKHPLAAAGMPRAEFLSAVRLLERRVLRGPRPQGGLEGLAALIAALPDGPGKADLLALHAALAASLGDFAHPGRVARPPADLLAAHLAAAEALATTPEQPGGLRLYAAQEGEVLAGHMADLAPALSHLAPIDPAAWPALFEASLEGIATRQVRLHEAAHPRVEILGLLEARLLAFDRVVLGALDEGVWPLATDPGPWMSRPMRAQFGLPEPEARIGRVCMDFFLFACAAKEAVLSRAARRGGSPTVAARWLTRLETFLAGQGLALAGSEAARWAAALDQPATVTPVGRPAPCPPAALRPREIAVTEVADLLADPYAFYARRVLRLRALDPLDADVGALDYGIIVHAALSGFIRRIARAPGGWPGEDQALADWGEAAAEALAAQGPRPSLAAFWRPRLARIGAFVVRLEAEMRQGGGIAASVTEVEARFDLPRPRGVVALKARADRIDRLGDGSLQVLDYKTGRVPGLPELQDGRAPQLPLEAALAEAGAFAGLPAAPVAALVYWKLSGGEVPGESHPMLTGAEEVAELAALSLDRLGRLLDRFLLGDAPFAARPHPARAARGGDYDHLARFAEWADAEGEE
ncbi:double-strand break repair protein AddB [Falsiroseomonas selenitidurans]|uniref:Double-strand break repair protein AddB n=1 Tax=Falsiroseomonas selenitidurans TaxID=2716335 RepID=A0ABX1E696_9PROT|nr:double-strand break repair protein AddB [Falsiroseomonas selenitidurans]NKC32308.1 double-strand break repair protein AddB [Falsiroseomonas selenitidurans]